MTSADGEGDGRSEPELSESLAGLVGAFDKLKETMGYEGGDDEIERFMLDIQTENNKLRQHAEDAIMMAQRFQAENGELYEENQSLMEELTQLKMNDMVSHAQELNTVACEYDKEVVLTKLAQAEEVMVYFNEMQQRVDELEEENAGLKETLHEMKEDQRQLKMLQSMEQSSPATESASKSLGQETPVTKAVIAEDDALTPMHNPVEEPSDMDGYISESQAYVTPLSAESIPAPGSATSRENAIVVADALATVAGGSGSGVAASASKMLREYHTLQSELEEEKQKNERLSHELEDLKITMTSKVFKPPSAWADREVKYQLEKKKWDESRSDLEHRVEELKAENEALGTMKGTGAYEKKVIDLEARLVESRRETDNLRASLHEAQLASLASAGEFSISGVKPYSTDDDVKSIVGKFESTHASREASSAGVSHQESDIDAKTPTSDKKTIQRLEDQLAKVRMEREEMNVHLAELLANEAVEQTAAVKSSEIQAKTELALLYSGVDTESAKKLAHLEAQLQEYQSKEGVLQDSDPSLPQVEDSEQDLKKKEDEIKEEMTSIMSNLTNLSPQDNTLEIEKPLNVGKIMEKIAANNERKGNTDQVIESALGSPKETEARIAELKAEIEAFSTKSSVTESAVSDVVKQEEVAGEEAPRKDVVAAAGLAARNRAQDNQIKDLQEMLAAATEKENKLKMELEAAKANPVKLHILPSPVNMDSASTISFMETTSAHEADVSTARKNADAAWEDHQRKSDVKLLLREKAELETKYEMSKKQLQKAQASLSSAEGEKKELQALISEAVSSGSVQNLLKRDQGARKKHSSPMAKLRSKNIFARKSSNKPQEDSLVVNDIETVNLRQKSSVDGQDINAASANILVVPPANPAVAQDVNVEHQALASLRQENEMLMDQLVTTKVRLAEVEGDCLQSRRALLRAKEKQIELARQLHNTRATVG